jgi:hypothetical protein
MHHRGLALTEAKIPHRRRKKSTWDSALPLRDFDPVRHILPVTLALQFHALVIRQR